MSRDRLYGLIILVLIALIPVALLAYLDWLKQSTTIAGYKAGFLSSYGKNELKDDTVYVYGNCNPERGCDNAFYIVFKEGLPPHLTLKMTITIGKQIHKDPFINYTEPSITVDIIAGVGTRTVPSYYFDATTGTYVIELYFNETAITRFILNGKEPTDIGTAYNPKDMGAYMFMHMYGDFEFNATIIFEP